MNIFKGRFQLTTLKEQMNNSGHVCGKGLSFPGTPCTVQDSGLLSQDTAVFTRTRDRVPAVCSSLTTVYTLYIQYL